MQELSREVETEFKSLSADTINDNYNMFLKGMVDVQVNSMEFILNDYSSDLEYLTDMIALLYKNYKEDNINVSKFKDADIIGKGKIKYFYAKGTDQNDSKIKEEMDFLSTIESDLYYYIKDSAHMYNCFIVTENGVSAISALEGDIKMNDDTNVSFNNSKWYKEAVATSSVVLTDVSNDVFSGKKVLSIAKSVITYDNKVFGVVGFDLVLEYMTAKNMGLSAIDSFNLFITDGKGNLVYNARGKAANGTNNYGESLVNFVKDAATRQEGFGFYEYNGNTYRTYYKKIGGTDYTLFSSVRDEKLALKADALNKSLNNKSEELTKSIYLMSRQMLLYFIIIIIVLVLIISLISKNISKHMSEPLKELSNVLDTAKNIQQNMLPKKFSDISNRKDVDVYAMNIPEAEVGGDFYNYIVDGNTLILIIADVSGSGIPAALFMARTNTLLNTAIRLSDSPKAILTYVNHELCKNNKDYYFVTIGLYYINLETKKVISTNSGHEDSIIIKKNGEVFVNKEQRSAPLGLEDYNKYEENKFDLGAGDKLFLFTDGVIEAINANNELYGIDRLIQNLKKVYDKKPKEVIDSVNEDISNYSKDLDQYDDITMLCLQINDIIEDEKLIHKYNQEFPANYESIDKIDEMIEEKLNEVYGTDEKYKDYLKTIFVCVEELVVNIVDYAYGGEDNTKTIWVDVVIDQNLDKLSICFKDIGKEFNPKELRDPNVLASIDNRKIGGLGVYITKSKMDIMDYKYEDGKNKLTITKFL